MLRDNGLDTLPGTAAEILDDEVRHVLSRNKLSSAQWQEVIRTAHACGIPQHFDTDVRAHGNSRSLGTAVVAVFRQIQSETGGFTEFVPLGFVHQNTLLFQQGLARSGPTLAEHLKIHALAQNPARRVDSQHSGLVGEVESQAFAALPARRRQRLRRDADGRKYFARGRSDRRPVHQS